MLDVRVITLANDASWGGWGWCLADQHGPIRVGHVALGPPRKRASKTKRCPNPPLLSTHRPLRMSRYVHEVLGGVVADGQLLLAPSDPLLRVVVEVPPLGFKRGKASAYVGVGRLVGAIELFGCRQSLAPPWVQEPGDWRAWWRIPPSRKGRGSAELKSDAIHLVQRLWGPEWLAMFSRTAKGGPRGDVAEAILLGVGSSRHPGGAPELPREWPACPVGIQYPPR